MIDQSIFHNPSDLADPGDIGRGISVHHEQVGSHSGSYATRFACDPENIGVYGSGGFQDVEGRHSIVDHHLHFPGVIAMWIYADVTSHTNLYPRGECLAEGFPFLADAFRFGVDSFSPTIVLRDGIAGGQRGAESDP